MTAAQLQVLHRELSAWLRQLQSLNRELNVRVEHFGREAYQDANTHDLYTRLGDLATDLEADCDSIDTLLELLSLCSTAPKGAVTRG